MSQFDELNRSVQGAIKAGRIGQPVFVRCLAAVAPGGDVPAALTQIVQAVQDWVGSPVRRLYAAESPAPAQRSLSVEFASGATALICTTTAAPDNSTIDLVVLGNRGAAYHESRSASGREGGRPTVFSDAAADPALRAALDAALRSEQPHVLPGRESP